jgi:beta-lactamase regulating signal transducer with metallopeptidase domain
MVLMVLSVAATIAYNYPSRTAGTAAVSHVPVRSILPINVDEGRLPAAASTTGIGLSGWVVCFWLAGVLALSGRAGGGWIRAQRLRRRGCQPVSPQLADVFERLKERLHISAPVSLYASAVARVPMVIGSIRPYVLLPVTAITGLTEDQLRLVLAHELAHIRRHDYLVNLLQTAIETVLFYHPAVWWVSHQVRVERENCCDDHSIEICGDTAAYAGALAQLEEFRMQAPEAAVAATGGALLRRIRRLLEPEQATHAFSKSIAAIVAAIFVIGAAIAPSMLSLGETTQSSTLIAQSPSTATDRATPGTTQQPAPEPRPQPLPQRIPQPAIQPEIGQEQTDPGAGLIGERYRLEIDKYNQAVDRLQRSVDFGKWIGPGLLAGPQNGPSEQSTDLLLRLYESSQDVDVKSQILDYLAMSKAPKASEKLLIVARSDANPELRRRAIDVIGMRPGSFDTLIALYDSKPDVETRMHIVDSLGMSQDQRALQKLFSIAQSDPDRDVRHHAVDCIAMH